MKIIAINSSYRGDRGHSRHLIDLLFQGAQAAGAEYEVVTLARQKISRCLACGECHMPEHYLKCINAEKDDVTRIFAKIAAADLLVYATPVYIFGISGLLKTFLDKLYSTSDINEMRVTRSGLFSTISMRRFVPNPLSRWFAVTTWTRKCPATRANTSELLPVLWMRPTLAS